MLALRKEDRSLKITVPLPVSNSSWSWRNSTFSKFQKFADGGPRRKTEKFWQIEKIIIDLYELDNSKKKIFFEKNFQIEIANVIFRPILNKSENIF